MDECVCRSTEVSSDPADCPDKCAANQDCGECMGPRDCAFCVTTASCRDPTREEYLNVAPGSWDADVESPSLVQVGQICLGGETPADRREIRWTTCECTSLYSLRRCATDLLSPAYCNQRSACGGCAGNSEPNPVDPAEGTGPRECHWCFDTGMCVPEYDVDAIASGNCTTNRDNCPASA